MAKHYLASNFLGGVLPVYRNEAGTSFSLSPDDTHTRSLHLEVRSDETGRYVQPPITDAQIDTTLASILQ
jgi:hypothetical protein